MPAPISIIDVTPMGQASNSYCDVPFATTFFAQRRLYSDAWRCSIGLATADGYFVQEVALIWATALLDKTCDFKGWKQTVQQALRWPRSGVFDRDGYYVFNNVVPIKIQEVTAQLAMELMKKNRIAEPKTLGIGISKTVDAGGTKVYLDPGNYTPFIPMYLREELYTFGLVDSLGAGRTGTVKLVRA